MIDKCLRIVLLLALIGLSTAGQAREPYRMGTTTANFLEIGIGAGNAMGDAVVASATDLSAIYWNPAGLAWMEESQAMFMYQPWVVDVNSAFAGFGLVMPTIGTISFAVFGLSYGDIDVTTLDYQDGTGEQYTAYDYSFSISYARKLVNWFSFGANAKYVQSKIWHSSAAAFALDLGVMVQTQFFSPTGKQIDGLKIGMSIANYGSRMQYDGYDLLFPVDIDEDAHGNYQNLQGKYKMSEWELPLVFRVGIAVTPIVTTQHKLTLEADALHPNNMSESINVGAEYQFSVPGFGAFFLRGGYKGLFLVDSNYGPSFGGGIKWYLSPNQYLNLDYSYRSLGDLGSVHCSGINFGF